jgi:hypothetical protein
MVLCHFIGFKPFLGGTTRDREIPTAPFHFRYWKRAVGKPVSPHVVGRLIGIRKPQRLDFSYTTAIFHVLVLV